MWCVFRALSVALTFVLLVKKKSFYFPNNVFNSFLPQWVCPKGRGPSTQSAVLSKYKFVFIGIGSLFALIRSDLWHQDYTSRQPRCDCTPTREKLSSPTTCFTLTLNPMTRSSCYHSTLCHRTDKHFRDESGFSIFSLTGPTFETSTPSWALPLLRCCSQQCLTSCCKSTKVF